MSDAPVLPKARPLRALLLGGGLIVAALGGAGLMRWWSAPNVDERTTNSQPRRPIVQIVRQQAGFPDQSELVDRICPSVALIVPAGAALPLEENVQAAPAALISDDGWLLTAASMLPKGEAEAIFDGGQRAAISDVRTDPVSGLALVRVKASPGVSVVISDQQPARAGQFVLAVAIPVGQGCSAGLAMVQGDFLSDGGAPQGYFRLQQDAAEWPAGLPLFAADGRLMGVMASGANSATALPSSVVGAVTNELLRGSLSPSTAFGFRAVDYAGSLATRLGDVRSGAGVSLVDPRSAAAKPGLRAGDIITRVNDNPVSSASELGRALDAVTDQAVLTVQRKETMRDVTVARAPQDNSPRRPDYVD